MAVGASADFPDRRRHISVFGARELHSADVDTAGLVAVIDRVRDESRSADLAVAEQAIAQKDRHRSDTPSVGDLRRKVERLGWQLGHGQIRRFGRRWLSPRGADRVGDVRFNRLSDNLARSSTSHSFSMHDDAPPQALRYQPTNLITDHHSQSPKPSAILSGFDPSDLPCSGPRWSGWLVSDWRFRQGRPRRGGRGSTNGFGELVEHPLARQDRVVAWRIVDACATGDAHNLSVIVGLVEERDRHP